MRIAERRSVDYGLRTAAPEAEPRSLYASRSGGTLAPEAGRAIAQARGGGQPVPQEVRAPFESRFQTDFTQVRVHSDAQADALSRGLSARAFTHGSDIFVRQGALAGTGGFHLLAHELAHVAQGDPGGAAPSTPAPREVSRPGDPAERSAAAAARAVVAGQPAPPLAPAPPGVVHREIELVPTGVLDEDGEDEIFDVVAEEVGGKRKGRREPDADDDGGDGFVRKRRQLAPAEDEKEADPDAGVAILEEDDDVAAQASRPAAAPGAPLVVRPEFPAAVASRVGHGERLPAAAQTEMESQFRRDFSAVRVHRDPAADKLSRSIDAAAFTVGRDIFFGSGHFAPRTASGRGLLAHELTHVVQQGERGSSPGGGAASTPAHPAEREAVRVERAVEQRRPVPRIAERASYGSVSWRHPGYAGKRPPNTTAIPEQGNQADEPPHQNPLKGLSAFNVVADYPYCVATLNWPGKLHLQGGQNHYKNLWTDNSHRPPEDKIVHRVHANKVRNPYITAKFAKKAEVKNFIENYKKATGYIGSWNMHHIWPLAWDGADHEDNLAPVPTGRQKKGGGLVAHQKHSEWHGTLLTDPGGQPGPPANQLPARQNPVQIGAHFKVHRM